MKTKINQIPLVGLKGRRELLDKIEELEKRGNSGTLKLQDIPYNVSADSYSEFLDALAYCGIDESILNDIFAGKFSKIVVENNNIMATYYMAARYETLGESISVYYGNNTVHLEFNQNDDGTYYAG